MCWRYGIWWHTENRKHKTEEELPPHLAQETKNSAVESSLRYLGKKLDLKQFSGHFSSGEKYQKDTKKAVLDSFFFQAEFPCDTKCNDISGQDTSSQES